MKLITRKVALSLGLNSYFTGKKCVNNHIAERRVYDWKCRECERERYRAWRKNNKEYERERYKKDPEFRSKKIKRAKLYYENNKESVNITKAKYNKENAKIVRERCRKYEAKWRKRPKSKSIMFMRRCLRRMIDYKKPASTELVLNYSRSDLISHIESLFDKGMTWDNYGKWQIDHIKPIDYFLSQGEMRPEIINALGNLQPLWASDNSKKGAKYEN